MLKTHKVLTAAVAIAALVTGCGGAAQAGDDGGAKLALDAALPTTVPDGTKIVVGDPATEVALKLSGQLDKVSKFVQFANLSGGPQTTEAFRAHALDVGSVAEIPPIHATWTGLHVKIVASKFRQDPLDHPIYQLGIAPGANVKTLPDLRGKKIAYSPGQAQGALVLKVLKKAGLTKDDVKLVELPSTGDVYTNALAAKQVDVAPIGGVQIKRYLAKYGKGRRDHDPARSPRRRRPPVRGDRVAREPGEGGRDPRVRRCLGRRAGLDRQTPQGVDPGVLREGPGTHRVRRSVAGRQRRSPGHQRGLE